MKLKSLINELQVLAKEHGEDMPVRLQTDHGQSLMSVTWCGVSHIDSDEYMTDAIHEDDLSEHPDATKVVEIQAF